MGGDELPMMLAHHAQQFALLKSAN